MNLNRKTYEEYFLLYTDHELSDTDRKMVEAFVLENPDLKPELDLFLASKFSMDAEIVFNNKEFLKKSVSIINESNYESYQLAFIDNELSGNLRNEFLYFNALNPAAQLNLDLLFKTKLEADIHLVYPDKNSLLSQNIVGRRVVPFIPYWLRISAAAAILLAISLFTFNPFKSNLPSELVSKTPSGNLIANENKTALVETNPVIEPETDHQSIVRKKDNQLNSGIYASPNFTAKNNLTSSTENADVVISTSNPVINTDELNPVKQINNQPNQTLNTEAAISLNRPSQQIINNSTVTSSLDETYNSQSTATNEFLINASTDDHSNKSLRGIFRKATRYFERTTNINTTDGEDKLLIAGIAINLK